MTAHPPEGRGVPSWCLVCATKDAPLERAAPQFCVYVCEKCKTEHFAGLEAPPKCHSCSTERLAFVRNIRDDEPVAGLCRPCRDLLNTSGDVFKTGGVLFRCSDCGARGHLAGDTLTAKKLRRTIPVPGFAGVTLTKKYGWPKCGGAA